MWLHEETLADDEPALQNQADGPDWLAHFFRLPPVPLSIAPNLCVTPTSTG